MSYIANQYNYATPLSSVAGLIAETSVVADKKYFTLSDNILDGSYFPISGDVGLWSASTSDDSGVLSEPFIITVTVDTSLRSFRIKGSVYNYPVDFVVKFYNGDSLVYTIEETGNSYVEYLHGFSENLSISHYEITITRISQSGAAARLYNVYYPAVMIRADTLRISASAEAVVDYGAIYRTVTDTAVVTCAANRSGVRNSFSRADTLNVAASAKGTPTNIHSVMKGYSRRVYGKVYITYTDPMLDSETTVTSDFTAYNSDNAQLMDGTVESVPKLFTLYENDLSGEYAVSSSDTQVGWTSNVLSDEYGNFVVPPVLSIEFASRPIAELTVYFDDSHSCVPKDFTVSFVDKSGHTVTKTFTGNTKPIVQVLDYTLSEITAVVLTVNSATRAGYPVTVLEIPIMSTFLYHGYEDSSKLMSIDLLEELTYEDDVEALGGVSANEVTVVLDNSTKEFNFDNRSSAAASQLRRNRKIEPWLGAEIVPGQIEWYKMGTFWSYSWKVPVGSLTATVVGFDTLGLLDSTDYINHYVQVNRSIGELIEYVLEDAKQSLSFIEYRIDEALYSVTIPYAWFERGSHTAALRKISKCYPMHIYCDRDGVICAAPQKLHLDFYYDTWSDDTNVINKEYNSLYTTLPNIVNVAVKHVAVTAGENLVDDSEAFYVNDAYEKTLNFSKPYVSNITVAVDCDTSVSYEYTAYSWGMSISFAGTGTVRSISCTGDVLDTSKADSVVTRRNADSMRMNGAVKRDVSSDFIQENSLASYIIDRLFSLSEYDKYDAAVVYRGDIALTINDPILLLNGIAPDNRYNIKRHKLFWDGALSGSADLNT